VEEKQKNFNFQNFIFDSLPNCTTYKIDATSNLFENVSYEKIDGTYKYITDNLPYKYINDDYSFYMNFPLQAIYFEEQFNKSKDIEEILLKEDEIENVINSVDMPIEFNFNNNENLKINSSLELNSKYDNQLENTNKTPIISNKQDKLKNTSKVSISTTHQPNTIINNSTNLYKIGSVKRIANPLNDNNASKRFKPNTGNNIFNNNNSNKNDSLNNITFRRTNSKPIVSILKKSNKNDKPKKRVSFKPDGTINQYKLIYLDGRDLHSKNKDNKDNKSLQDIISSSPNEFPNYHFSKLMEIPVLYTEALRSEEELEERALQKKRKTKRYYLDKEISFSPRETPAKKIKNKFKNDPSINKYTLKIPQWGSKAFVKLINRTIKSTEYHNRIKQFPEYHPNLGDLSRMDNFLNSNIKIIELQKETNANNFNRKIKRKHLKRQRFLNNIFLNKIPKTINPIEFLYEKCINGGYIKQS